MFDRFSVVIVVYGVFQILQKSIKPDKESQGSSSDVYDWLTHSFSSQAVLWSGSGQGAGCPQKVSAEAIILYLHRPEQIVY